MNEKLNLLLTQLSSVIFGKERECRLTICAPICPATTSGG